MVLYLFSALWASSELWGLGAGVEGVNGAIMESSSFEAEYKCRQLVLPFLGGPSRLIYLQQVTVPGPH